MSCKPILFSTTMVQAIIAGSKTMTRRVAKFLDNRSPTWSGYEYDEGKIYGSNNIPASLPKYQPGDILWVRETWREFSGMFYGWQGGAYIPLDDCAGYNYKADDSHSFTKGTSPFIAAFEDMKDDIKYGAWRPSIFMPKEACRIFLRVTDVRAERLQEITEADAKAEGVCGLCYDAETGKEKYDMTFFKVLWDGINAKRGYGWDKNPWVWVYTFERIDKPEGWPEHYALTA